MEDYINMLYYKPCLGEQVANINLIYTLFCRGRNLLIDKTKNTKKFRCLASKVNFRLPKANNDINHMARYLIYTHFFYFILVSTSLCLHYIYIISLISLSMKIFNSLPNQLLIKSKFTKYNQFYTESILFITHQLPELKSTGLSELSVTY